MSSRGGSSVEEGNDGCSVQAAVSFAASSGGSGKGATSSLAFSPAVGISGEREGLDMMDSLNSAARLSSLLKADLMEMANIIPANRMIRKTIQNMNILRMLSL